MELTKTLGKKQFRWNPNAFGGKGYWFVLGKNGGLGLAASKVEYAQLGVPSKNSTEPKSPDVYKQKPMSYQEANKFKKKSLSSLITEKIVGGQSISKSIRSSISEKFRAKMKRSKEMFDPMNIARKLTGNVGAAIYGKLRGRSTEDMEYFTGVKSKKEKTQNVKGTDAESNSEVKVQNNKNFKKIEEAMYTKVSEKQRGRMRKGDNLAVVLSRLYNLMLIHRDDEKKEDAQKMRDEKQKEKDEKQWHKELLEALRGRRIVSKGTASKDDSSIFDFIINLAKSILNKIKSFIEGIYETLKPIFEFLASPIFGVLKNIVKVGSWVSKFLAAADLVAALKISIPLLAGAVATYLAGNEQVKAMRAAEKGDFEATKQAEGRSMQYQQGAFSEFDSSADSNADAAARQELQSAAGRGSKEAQAKLKELEDDDKKNEKKIKYVQSLGYTVDDGVIGLAHKGGFLGFGGQRISQTELDDANKFAEGKIELPKSTSTPATPTATPMVSSNTQTKQKTPPPSVSSPPQTVTPMATDNPAAKRVLNAIKESNNAKLDEMVGSTNVVINKPNTVVAAGGNGSPGVLLDTTVSVRIDDPTLLKIQKQNLRPV